MSVETSVIRDVQGVGQETVDELIVRWAPKELEPVHVATETEPMFCLDRAHAQAICTIFGKLSQALRDSKRLNHTATTDEPVFWAIDAMRVEVAPIQAWLNALECK